MGMSICGGKCLSYKGCKIGLNTEVRYTDQNNTKCKINIKKFVKLAKQCKEKDNKRYFEQWIKTIEAGELSIGIVIIDGLNRIATELGEKALECIDNS